MKIPPRPIDPCSHPTTPGEAAWQAADAIRALNHLTLASTGPRAGYTFPGDVDTVIGALLTLTQRLPQAFGQASSWLTSQHRRGRIGHDQQPPPHDKTLAEAPAQPRTDAEDAPLVSTAVAKLCADLHTATKVSADLAAVLHDARAASCHLSAR